MKDSILILHLPLAPGLKAAKELADAGWKNVTTAVYFLRSNESQISAHIRMFSDKFPNAWPKNAIQVVPIEPR